MDVSQYYISYRKIKMKKYLIILLSCIILSGCGNNGSVENVPISEFANEADIPVVIGTHTLNEFAKMFWENGSEENIKKLSEGMGLFCDDIFVGNTEGDWYKIALTKEDATMYALNDRYKGDYYILISDAGNTLRYFNNIDQILIICSKSTGIAVIDGGTYEIPCDTLDEAFEYVPKFKKELTSLEEFFVNVEIGMPKAEVIALISDYGLTREDGRSNSTAWHVYLSPITESLGTEYVSYVYYSGKTELGEIEYHNYAIESKYSIYIIGDSEGYRIVGGNTSINYDSALDAVNALFEYE